MKLVIISPYPLDNDTDNIHGGVEAVAVNLLKGLLRFKDLDIHVLTVSHVIDKDRDFKSNGLTIHAVAADKRFGNITLYSKTRKRICRKINDIKPDLIHSHMLGYHTLAALESGHPKVVISTHGITEGNWGVSCTLMDKMRRYLQDLIREKCLKRAKNIIVNSRFSEDFLKSYKIRNLYRLNNPISDPFFNIDADKEEENRILFAGNISEAKGVGTLIEAVRILKGSFKDIRVMVAGPVSDSSFYAKLEGFIRENNLTGAVNFLGHLNENKLREEYAKASIFVFPSQQDVAPLALLQAMACGKAIVSTRVGGIPYIVDDSVNGFLVNSKNPNALADMVAVLLMDKSLRKDLGDNAKKKISKGHRIDSVAEELYAIYRRFEDN
ncbi:MAG: glycosyltransferase family 4 protein [Candidatus Gorgyraea atricola]|nr:glycosyltransferase family 4 protein [Candidatus Gorgyraea atricola]